MEFTPSFGILLTSVLDAFEGLACDSLFCNFTLTCVLDAFEGLACDDCTFPASVLAVRRNALCGLCSQLVRPPLVGAGQGCRGA